MFVLRNLKRNSQILKKKKHEVGRGTDNKLFYIRKKIKDSE
jgi:hypothetical protein